MTNRATPPLATLLAFILPLTGGLLGCALGSWVVPVGYALANGGWSAVGDLSRSHAIFAVLPDLPSSDGATVMNWAHGAFSVVGLVSALLLGFRIWRFLVVQKLALMTDKEVEEFYKRDPGY